MTVHTHTVGTLANGPGVEFVVPEGVVTNPKRLDLKVFGTWSPFPGFDFHQELTGNGPKVFNSSGPAFQVSAGLVVDASGAPVTDGNGDYKCMLNNDLPITFEGVEVVAVQR